MSDLEPVPTVNSSLEIDQSDGTFGYNQDGVISDQEQLEVALNPGRQAKIANLFNLTQNILKQTNGQDAKLIFGDARTDYDITVRPMPSTLSGYFPRYQEIRISNNKARSMDNPVAYYVYKDSIMLQLHGQNDEVSSSDPPTDPLTRGSNCSKVGN